MAAEIIAERIYRRFATPALALVSVNLVGMLGYKIIGGSQVSWLDCLYMTFITVAVNPIGKAFALGYQHFTLAPESTSQQLDFGSTLPAGKYVVHVDAVAEVPSKNVIHRARLQTSTPLTLTGLP